MKPRPLQILPPCGTTKRACDRACETLSKLVKAEPLDYFSSGLDKIVPPMTQSTVSYALYLPTRWHHVGFKGPVELLVEQEITNSLTNYGVFRVTWRP